MFYSCDVKIIVKDPIELPCDHSICREHLKERDVDKANKYKIQWMKTRVWSQRKWISNRIKHTRSQKRERESQCCLSEEEISLKVRIRRVSIRKFVQFYEQIQLNWENQCVNTNVFNHFHEIRFQNRWTSRRDKRIESMTSLWPWSIE